MNYSVLPKMFIHNCFLCSAGDQTQGLKTLALSPFLSPFIKNFKDIEKKVDLGSTYKPVVVMHTLNTR
jgi:hypothetical protein